MKKMGRYEKAPEKKAPQQAKKKTSPLLQTYLMSLLSLVLCCVMFLGTTVARFTADVTSTGNEIYIGTLKVDLMQGESSVVNQPVFSKSIVWSPDLMVSQTLEIVNKGELAFQYELSLSKLGWTDEHNTALAEIGGLFTVHVFTGELTEEHTHDTFAALDADDAWKDMGTLKDVIEQGTLLAKGEITDVLNEDGTIKNTAESVSIAIHMSNDAGSEVMGRSVYDIGIKLVASQKNFEDTSTPVVGPDTLQELLNSETAPAAIDLPAGAYGDLTISKDVALNGAEGVNFTGTLTVTNGAKVTLSKINFAETARIYDNGASELTVDGCTVTTDGTAAETDEALADQSRAFLYSGTDAAGRELKLTLINNTMISKIPTGGEATDLCSYGFIYDYAKLADGSKIANNTISTAENAEGEEAAYAAVSTFGYIINVAENAAVTVEGNTVEAADCGFYLGTAEAPLAGTTSSLTMKDNAVTAAAFDAVVHSDPATVTVTYTGNTLNGSATLGGTTTNLLANGDFELLNGSNQFQDWNIYNGTWGVYDKTVFVATETPHSGSRYLKLVSGNTYAGIENGTAHSAGQLDFTTSVELDVDSAMNIPFSAWVNVPSTNEGFEAYFDIYIYAGSTQQKRMNIYVEKEITEHDQWVEITKDIPVNAETTKVKIEICVREMTPNQNGAPSDYTTKDGVWSGAISIDNITVIGPSQSAQ